MRHPDTLVGPDCQQACDLEPLCKAYTATASPGGHCILWSATTDKAILPDKVGWHVGAGHGASDAVEVTTGDGGEYNGLVHTCMKKAPPPPTYIQVGTGHCRDAQGGWPAYYMRHPDTLVGPDCQQACDLEPLCKAYTATASPGGHCILWSATTDKAILPDKVGWHVGAGHGASDAVEVTTGDGGEYNGLVHTCMKKA